MEKRQLRYPDNFKRNNKVRSIIAMSICSAIFLLTMAGFIIDLLVSFRDNAPESSLRTFRMFTTLSNLFMAMVSALSIPYYVDGIRHNEHYFPRWLTVLSFIGVCCVALTFVSAATLIVAAKGAYHALVKNSALLLHVLCPLLSIVLFVLIKPHHEIKFYQTVFPMIPVFAYVITYFIMVIVIGPENGGWNDHYYTNTYMPWYVSSIMMLLLSYGIDVLLRFGHNVFSKIFDKAFVAYYMESSVFDVETIEEAVEKVANEQYETSAKSYMKIPVKVLGMLKERFHSELTIDALCKVYLDAVLRKHPK